MDHHNSSCNFTEYEDHEHKQFLEASLKSILFIFTCTLVGALSRQFLKNFSFPYTVVLFVMGTLIGFLDTKLVAVEAYTGASKIDPHLLMQIFLPILIFESAFGMEAHMFFRAIVQCIILAIPGMLFCTFLTAAFSKAVLRTYHWDWVTSLLFGAILSATDPVAVVALLKECGISPTLTTIIEGESLLNDGSAIVIFEVLMHTLESKQEISAGYIATDFVKTCFGAPLFGYLIAITSTWLLSQVYNDSVVEITITFSVAYLTYYLADRVLKISGVLAVVILGVVMSSNKSSISPEVEKSVHNFWEMLSYIANTLIFIICGIIIAEKGARKLEAFDCLLILGTYIAVTFFRFIMIVMFSPILQRIGYGLTFRQVIVLTWGGLRGAVGLALALMLREIDSEINARHEKEYSSFADKILLQVSGIIVLTLVVNGTTMECLLRTLGMREVSPTHRLAMMHAVSHLKDVSVRSNRVQRMDKFTGGANWMWVKEKTEMDDPYEFMGGVKQAIFSSFLPFRYGVCKECAAEVVVETTEEELEEIKEVSRLRILKALKASLWNQYECGLITRRTVQLLIPAVEDTADIPEKYLTAGEVIRRFMHINSFTRVTERFTSSLLKKIPQETVSIDHKFALKDELRSVNVFRAWCIKIYLSKYFEPLVILILLLNTAPLIWELIVIYHETGQHRSSCVIALDIVNLFFVLFYITEAIIKIVALEWPNYIGDHWNKFSLLVAVLSALEAIVDIIIYSTSRTMDQYIDYVQFLVFVRLFRVVRTLNSLLNSLMLSLQSQVSSQLYSIYDLGHAFVRANEEVTRNIYFLIDYAPCAFMPLSITTSNIMEMIAHVDTMELENPGISIALKSHHSARLVLNDMMNALRELQEEGLAEEAESEVLKESIEEMIKKVLRSPKNLPPDVDVHDVLQKVEWLTNEALYKIVLENFVIRTYKTGQLILDIDSEPDGIAIISSGVVRVSGRNEAEASSSLPNTDSMQYFQKKGRFIDYLVTSSSMGVLGFLVQTPYVTTCICETDCQLIYIKETTLIQAEKELKQDMYFAMWRPIALKISAIVLDEQPRYLGWSQENIKLRLERAVLPYLYDIEKFEVNGVVEDMVIIQGRARDLNSGTLYIGPSYIPSTVRVINLIDDPDVRHRVVMVFLINERQIAPNNMDWIELDDIGHEELCLKHSARRTSFMIDAGALPPRNISKMRGGATLPSGLKSMFWRKSVDARLIANP